MPWSAVCFLPEIKFCLLYLHIWTPPPTFQHWPTNKKNAQKKTTAMPLTSDPSRLRVTSCQKANKSSSCTERKRIKRPTYFVEAKGWSNLKTFAMGEKVHNFFLYQFGWRLEKIQHWVWNRYRYRAQFLNEDLSFKWSKDKPYKDLVEFPVNLDVYNYISMALWPSCTTVDVRNAGNSSWWVVGPLS